MMNRLSYAIGKVSCCHTKLISVESKVKEFGGWESSARENSVGRMVRITKKGLNSLESFFLNLWLKVLGQKLKNSK